MFQSRAPFQTVSYLVGPTFHVFEVPFGYDAPHGKYAVAVTVMGVQNCRVQSVVVLLGGEAAGVLDSRVQRVFQMVLRREARSERRRLRVLRIFVEDHPRSQRALAPGTVR